MLNLVRTGLHRAITTPVGDSLLAIRLPKDLARRMNVMVGEPICSQAELDRRRAGRARLEELKRNGGRSEGGEERPAPLQAPVTVYFEKDRNARILGRIQELLDAKGVRYTLLDITGDATSRAFVMREARVKDEDFPIVFVASAPVGGFTALVDWDVSGRLARALRGDP